MDLVWIVGARRCSGWSSGARARRASRRSAECRPARHEWWGGRAPGRALDVDCQSGGAVWPDRGPRPDGAILSGARPLLHPGWGCSADATDRASRVRPDRMVAHGIPAGGASPCSGRSRRVA